MCTDAKLSLPSAVHRERTLRSEWPRGSASSRLISEGEVPTSTSGRALCGARPAHAMRQNLSLDSPQKLIDCHRIRFEESSPLRAAAANADAALWGGRTQISFLSEAFDAGGTQPSRFAFNLLLVVKVSLQSFERAAAVPSEGFHPQARRSEMQRTEFTKTRKKTDKFVPRAVRGRSRLPLVPPMLPSGEQAKSRAEKTTKTSRRVNVPPHGVCTLDEPAFPGGEASMFRLYRERNRAFFRDR